MKINEKSLKGLRVIVGLSLVYSLMGFQFAKADDDKFPDQVIANIKSESETKDTTHDAQCDMKVVLTKDGKFAGIRVTDPARNLNDYYTLAELKKGKVTSTRRGLGQTFEVFKMTITTFVPATQASVLKITYLTDAREGLAVLHPWTDADERYKNSHSHVFGIIQVNPNTRNFELRGKIDGKYVTASEMLVKYNEYGISKIDMRR